ncbi:MAG: uroporphyrinogen-III synthase [Gemmatimonadota bacterium]|nr:uroporphyrinogen-III synthase [Gemmatimonadota bacterium]
MKPRVVLTRSREASEEWRRRLEGAGVGVLVLPLIAHEPLSIPQPLPGRPFDWILFASPESVRAFFRAGLDAVVSEDGTRMGVLGPGTGAELARHGGVDDLRVRTRDGAEFAQAFTDTVPAPTAVLVPGPKDPLPELASGLRAAGHQVVELALYRTVACRPPDTPEDPFREGDRVFFASPSAVRAFCAAYGPHAVPCVAIGATTAAAAREAGLDPAVAERPDLESLMAAAGLPFGSPRPEPEATR